MVQLHLQFPVATPPTSVSNILSPTQKKSRIHSFRQILPRTARTFPANGKFTPPQRELYAALLATQKALVRECAVARGHSLDTLHRRSVDLLRTELERVGLPCAGTVLERVLYPHYLTHPIGIGKPYSSFEKFELISIWGLLKN